MPLYFFHVDDGSDFVDEVGTELPDVAEARTQAVVAAGEALKSHATAFWSRREWFMHVTDENGEAICQLKFSADRRLINI